MKKRMNCGISIIFTLFFFTQTVLFLFACIKFEKQKQRIAKKRKKK